MDRGTARSHLDNHGDGYLRRGLTYQSGPSGKRIHPESQRLTEAWQVNWAVVTSGSGALCGFEQGPPRQAETKDREPVSPEDKRTDTGPQRALATLPG